MDVYYALLQSVYQLYAVYILQNDRGNNIPFGCFVPPIPSSNVYFLFAITDSAFQQFALFILQNAITLDAI